jgi:crossover junction endodeoxyribonuclease RuvC
MILGIDPGLSGALAFMNDNGSLQIFDMPTIKAGAKGRNFINDDEVARIIDAQNGISCSIKHAFVELVGVRPGEGGVGAFSFGKGCGILQGVLAANFVPRTYVTPVKWKKALGVPKEKDGARARASQLMPQHSHLWTRVKDHGRAEAALIAYYGLKNGSA